MTALLARASEPTASLVGSCEASSNTTRSKRSGSGRRYCATVIGLMRRQGARRGKSAGISSKKSFIFMPRMLLLSMRWKASTSRLRSPSVDVVGSAEISLERICARES